MNINEYKEKPEYMELVDGMELSLKELKGVSSSKSIMFNKKQYTLYFPENKAITVSQPLFIDLQKHEKTKEGQTYILKKETIEGEKKIWRAIPIEKPEE